MSSPLNLVRRAWVLLLALLTMVSWAATWTVFRLAKHYYRQLQAVRLDPLGLAQPTMAAKSEQPALVFYGDSRAAQWPPPSGFSASTLNLGIGAQTTAQVLYRFHDQLGQLHPKCVVVEVGINDLKTIPLFPEAEEKIIATCKGNIERIVQLCRAQGAHVVVSTVFPLGKVPLERRLVWSDRVAPAIDEVNRHIRTLTADDVTVFDAAGVLTGTDGKLIPSYSHDLLHLSAAGYDRLNEKLADQIRVK